MKKRMTILDKAEVAMKKAVKIGAVMDKDGKKALFGLHKGPTVDMIINTIGYGQPLTELRFSNVKKQFAELKYYYASVHFMNVVNFKPKHRSNP